MLGGILGRHTFLQREAGRHIQGLPPGYTSECVTGYTTGYTSGCVTGCTSGCTSGVHGVPQGVLAVRKEVNTPRVYLRVRKEVYMHPGYTSGCRKVYMPPGYTSGCVESSMYTQGIPQGEERTVCTPRVYLRVRKEEKPLRKRASLLGRNLCAKSLPPYHPFHCWSIVEGLVQQYSL